MNTTLRHITEPISANNAARVDPHTIFNFGAWIKRDVWKKIYILAQMAIGSNEIRALQNRARANTNIFADNTKRADVCRRIDLCGWRNDCRGMHPGGESRFGKKPRQDFGKRNSSV